MQTTGVQDRQTLGREVLWVSATQIGLGNSARIIFEINKNEERISGQQDRTQNFVKKTMNVDNTCRG
jgi:hypothetical protein